MVHKRKVTKEKLSRTHRLAAFTEHPSIIVLNSFSVADTNNLQSKSSTAFHGTGKFSNFTYGTGEPKTTNVLGASKESVDWSAPEDKN